MCLLIVEVTRGKKGTNGFLSLTWKEPTSAKGLVLTSLCTQTLCATILYTRDLQFEPSYGHWNLWSKQISSATSSQYETWLEVEVSQQVMYILYNSAPTDRLKTKLLQKGPLMLGKTVKTVKFRMRLSKQPKEGQSYQRFKSAINDSLIAGKSRFFAKTSAKLNKFLVSHQMEKPMVPFIGHMHQPSCLERSWKKLFVIIQYQFKGCSMHKRATHVNLLTPIKIELSDLSVQVWCGFLFISFMWSFVQEVTHEIFSYRTCMMFHPQLTCGSTWNRWEKKSFTY